MPIFTLDIFGFSFAPSYYGLMYILGFSFCYGILLYRARYIFSSGADLFKKSREDLLWYIFLGVIIGGRLWYVLFYNFSYYFHNFWEFFYIWEWGMSFHWWVLWVIVGMFFYVKKYWGNIFSLWDEITAVLPIWLWLWRIGNYINKELLGFAPYDWWFAVYKNGVWYFPSPLVEAVLEWLLLFIVLNFVYYKKQFTGQIAALFLILYWIFRMFVEFFFRSPDVHLWYMFSSVSLGFLLSIPMVFVWFFLYWRLRS